MENPQGSTAICVLEKLTALPTLLMFQNYKKKVKWRVWAKMASESMYK